MFDHFGDTKFTCGEGYGFKWFGLFHLSLLLITVVICVVLGRLFKKWPEEKRDKCLKIVAIILLIDELLKYVVTIAYGNFRVDFLPLHLCSIHLFAALAHAFMHKDVFAESLYAVCLPTAILALLFPGWNTVPLTSFMMWHSQTVHMLLTLYPILLLCGGFKPSFKRLAKTIPFYVVAIVGAYFINKNFGTNFFYLVSAPIPIFETLLHEHFYLLYIPIVGLVLVLMYLVVPKLFLKK